MTSCAFVPPAQLGLSAIGVVQDTAIGTASSALAGDLAPNSVMRSARRLSAGRFLVRVIVFDGRRAAVTVTDQGSPFAPRAAVPDGESGRGLAVVRSLACLFRMHDHDGLRTFTALIAAPDTTLPGAPDQPFTARAPAAMRSPAGACP
jgi:hypothetical protein